MKMPEIFKSIHHFLLLAAIAMSADPALAATSCDMSKLDMKAIMEGVPAAEFVKRMRQVCDFIETASNKLSARGNTRELEILGAGQLQTLQEEGVEIVMVVGRSADYLPEEAARIAEVRGEMLSLLNRFDPKRTIFIGGGTASGDIGLFHELATDRGFPMMGFTPISGVEYEPALMSHLYLETGIGFGAESNMAVHTATSILMLGGGKQSARESIKGAMVGGKQKPIYIVENERFGGKSSEAAAALKDFPNVKVFKSAAAAGDVMANRSTSDLMKRLPEGAFDSTIEDFNEVYHGKYKLGFSTWANNPPSKSAEKKFQKFSKELLDKLDPNQVVIVVSGTKNGGEGFIIDYALKRGFTVVGTPAREVLAADLDPRIHQFIETGTSWSTRNRFFMNTFDGIVTAGESYTILSHIETAQKLGKQVFNVEGISASIDTFTANLGGAPNFSEAKAVAASIYANHPCNKNLEPAGK